MITTQTTMTRTTRVLFLAAFLILAGCAEGEHSDKDDDSSKSSKVEYLTGGSPDASLPFSPAVRVGNTLYLSGQIGNFPGTLDLAEVEHLYDVGVVEVDDELGLVDEYRDELAVCAEVREDALDGIHFLEAVGAEGLRPEDLRHSAYRNALEELVAAKGFWLEHAGGSYAGRRQTANVVDTSPFIGDSWPHLKRGPLWRDPSSPTSSPRPRSTT